MPPHHNRIFDFAFLDQVVYRESKLRALSVSEPADTRGQTLKLDSLAREINPAAENAIVREQFEHEIVGHMNVRRLARQRDPPERPAAFAKQWTNICRHKSGEV